MEGAPCPQSRNGSPAPLSSSAADTATSPKMAHDREQSRQSLYREAGQVANAVDGTAGSPVPHRRTPAATRRAAGSNPRSPGAAGARYRDHARQTGRVRQRRPSRGCQPERGAAAVAGRGRVGNYPERADVGTGHRGSRQTRRPVARSARRGGPTQGPTGHRRRNFLGPNRS